MLTTFIAFVFVLGVLVFVHELGHFLVAKWIGVRVHTFSIGFGTRLLGFKRGDTDYRLSAVPLGGYVKMAGENPDDEITGAPYEFSSRSVPERMAIILAGPIMNLIFAVIFFTIIFKTGVEQPLYFTEKPVIGWVAENSAAAEAGIEINDQIIEVEGTRVANWREVLAAVSSISAGELTIVLQRGGEKVEAVFEAPDSTGFREGGLWGAFPAWRYQIASVRDDGAAREAGLQAGDIFVKIADTPVHIWPVVQNLIETHVGTPIECLLLRGEETVTKTVVPQLDEKAGVGRIGIAVREETRLVKYGFVESVQRGVNLNIQMAGLLFNYLGRVFSGKESADQIGGPIMIARVAGEAARLGWDALLEFMGFLSLQLGILNLLPIPILDGGHMLLLTIEGISGKPLSLKNRGIAQLIGLVILLSLTVFVFFNDITRWISGN